MGEGERWWRNLNESLKDDPVFIAEGIALDIALNVSDRLAALGITRKELAGRLGVSPPYVSQILGGQTNLTVLTLCKLSAALGMKLHITLREPRVRDLFTAIDSLASREMAYAADAASGSTIPAKETPSRLQKFGCLCDFARAS